MDIDISSLEVVHNQAKKRFEINVNSHTAVLTYILNGKTILFTHTGVPHPLEGQGVGAKLVKAGLEFAKENKLQVNTTCWFVNLYIKRHPDAV
jgi:predicted GNAT family acetyltransferase